MPESELRCPKCSGSLNEGFLADYAHAAVIPGRWVKGRPQRSIWRGTNLRDRIIFRMSAYRCATCGYVELYARERVD
jgi:hypothetical protein